ncbi:hypothetical protein C8R47DRAFT_1064207 [Mycena vitilis]|nr:hypothetical protein C8R47DRAFT_1064207 [Mycena vitilis]
MSSSDSAALSTSSTSSESLPADSPPPAPTPPPASTKPRHTSSESAASSIDVVGRSSSHPSRSSSSNTSTARSIGTVSGSIVAPVASAFTPQAYTPLNSEDNYSSNSSLSGGKIAGISVGVVTLILALLLSGIYIRRRRARHVNPQLYAELGVAHGPLLHVTGEKNRAPAEIVSRTEQHQASASLRSQSAALRQTLLRSGIIAAQRELDAVTVSGSSHTRGGDGDFSEEARQRIQAQQARIDELERHPAQAIDLPRRGSASNIGQEQSIREMRIEEKVFAESPANDVHCKAAAGKRTWTEIVGEERSSNRQSIAGDPSTATMSSFSFHHRAFNVGSRPDVWNLALAPIQSHFGTQGSWAQNIRFAERAKSARHRAPSAKHGPWTSSSSIRRRIPEAVWFARTNAAPFNLLCRPRKLKLLRAENIVPRLIPSFSAYFLDELAVSPSEAANRSQYHCLTSARGWWSIKDCAGLRAVHASEYGPRRMVRTKQCKSNGRGAMQKEDPQQRPYAGERRVFDRFYNVDQ